MNNNIISRKQIVAIMTTRPVQIQIKKTASSSLKMYSYYVDYLCVEKEQRKKGIAPITIYSHYLNQRYKHENIVFLFITKIIVSIVLVTDLFHDEHSLNNLELELGLNYDTSLTMPYKL